MSHMSHMVSGVTNQVETVIRKDYCRSLMMNSSFMHVFGEKR